MMFSYFSRDTFVCCRYDFVVKSATSGILIFFSFVYKLDGSKKKANFVYINRRVELELCGFYRREIMVVTLTMKHLSEES